MKWVTNTLLSDTDTFARQYNMLEVDVNSSLGAVAALSVPDSFDGRQTWRLYLPPVKNQCNCGGCWAFATSAALAARINIWTTNRVHVDLSPSKMIYCNWGADEEYELVKRAFDRGLDFSNMDDDIAASVDRVGCSGETLIGAWQFLYRYGGTTERCHPYRKGKFDLCTYGAGQRLPSCQEISGPDMNQCEDGSIEVRYRAGGFYMVAGPLHLGEVTSDSANNNSNNSGSGNNVSGNSGNNVNSGNNSGSGSGNSGNNVNSGNNSGSGSGNSNRGNNNRKGKRKYSAEHTRRHIAHNVARIQREVYKFGPVTTGMRVYADLFDWRGDGVYVWDGVAPFTGGHAVVITGWGTMTVNGTATPYWQVQNSWGAEWGDRGYFRILRGANHCDIEVNVMAGYPDMPLSDRFLLQPRTRTPEDLFLRHVWQYDTSGYDLMDIHRMILDEEPHRDLNPIYTAAMVPDYATMVAGKPWAITYPYAVSRIRWGLLLFVVLLCVVLLSAAVAMIMSGH